MRRKQKLAEDIDTDTTKLNAKRGKWDPLAIADIADIEVQFQQKKDTLSNITSMLSPVQDKEHKQKLNQMRKRRARKLRTTQGNRCLLDSDDEEFVAKCIEDKATYHGRRHDMVMYTNRRVKKNDLLNIANYRLLAKKKKLIKSATTVYNCCKPRSSTSIQSKQHRGKGLFCTKKLPKAEDVDNENTHFQRAHMKNVKFSFFGRV